MAKTTIASSIFSQYLKKNSYPKYEFHVAAEIRKKYEIEDEFFSIEGNLIFANFHAVRKLVHKINSKRNPQDHVQSGKVNAAALIDEIYHYIFRIYEESVNPGILERAANLLINNIGDNRYAKLLFEFVELFPPNDVFRERISTYDYVNSITAGKKNTEIILEELILLHFANQNPANKKIRELFDDNYFKDRDLYRKTIALLEEFFKEEKRFGLENQDIFTFFKSPFQYSPEDIEGQLDFIREKWGVLLNEDFLKKLLRSKDFIKEEYILGGGPGGAPIIAPQFFGVPENADILRLGKSGFQYALEAQKDYEEPENFSADTDWMPKVVLIAKNTYVWLDQLSKKYQRHITRLDQIPDEELETLKRWGFNALWLIGIWERSSASKKIKHLMGNIDAIGSAYSLYDYIIAQDLGGEEAYQNLNKRARHFGIRLASDMVPNHTGIYSRWIVEHPDYFIQTSYPPFPSYSFTGPNLSDDPAIQIRIEDGYWDRSDAAVVFEWINNYTGERRYIYHGNDGTNMPWNDTAQLDMIKAEMREAVIQKILEVARKFSIIRFDAAMTLTKRHFSRLWYPEPGKGGDIPSRSDFSMSQDEFDRLFPKEFWREVVDRINQEMPDTLLLAEAFWLMEGYFVRTLGMHRVYNSAFMHMLMKEENDKFRDLITNTLEFEPEILKRYVNFMSNPDEETAIKQFGTNDKYFGVCILMSTLPGLPMFAHGQIEGLTEKYGMEYQRAYYHESPNQWLIDRHEREIFPLLRRRYLFCNVENFWFYDFIDDYGYVNENVVAFTNQENGEKSLVFYNNKYQTTSGKIFRSTPKLVQQGSKKELHVKTLTDALGIKPSKNYYYIFREHITNLEYLKSGYDLSIDGFYIELKGFQSSVFWDFREIYDEFGDWEKLERKLQGNGAPSISRAMIEMQLEPIHSAFLSIFEEDPIKEFYNNYIHNSTESNQSGEILKQKFNKLIDTICSQFELVSDTKLIWKNFELETGALRLLNSILQKHFVVDEKIPNKELHKAVIANEYRNYKDDAILYLIWLVVSNLSLLFEDDGDLNKKNYINKILLDSPIRQLLQRIGKGEYELLRELLLLKILQDINNGAIEMFCDSQENEKEERGKYGFNCILKMLDDESVKTYIGVNEYEGIVYFSKENFEEFLDWLFTLSITEKIILYFLTEENKYEVDQNSEKKIVDIVKKAFKNYTVIKKLSEESGYRIDIFKDFLRKQ